MSNETEQTQQLVAKIEQARAALKQQDRAGTRALLAEAMALAEVLPSAYAERAQLERLAAGVDLLDMLQDEDDGRLRGLFRELDAALQSETPSPLQPGSLLRWPDVPSGAFVRWGTRMFSYAVRIGNTGWWTGPRYDWKLSAGEWPWALPAMREAVATVVALNLTGDETPHELERMVGVFNEEPPEQRRARARRARLTKLERHPRVQQLVAMFHDLVVIEFDDHLQEGFGGEMEDLEVASVDRVLVAAALRLVTTWLDSRTVQAPSATPAPIFARVGGMAHFFLRELKP